MTPLTLLVVALAAARTTRLITTDTITEWLRVRLSDRPFWYELVTCPWCVGFWISAGWVLVWWTVDGRAVWLAAPFAVSYVVGWLETHN